MMLTCAAAYRDGMRHVNSLRVYIRNVGHFLKSLTDPNEVQRLWDSGQLLESEREVVGEIQHTFPVLGTDGKWLADTKSVDADHQIAFVVLLQSAGRPGWCDLILQPRGPVFDDGKSQVPADLSDFTAFTFAGDNVPIPDHWVIELP